jgi:hypothetical protein
MEIAKKSGIPLQNEEAEFIAYMLNKSKEHHQPFTVSFLYGFLNGGYFV